MGDDAENLMQIEKLLGSTISVLKKHLPNQFDRELADDFSKMALCFALHQLKHSESVEVLLKKDLVGEALILVRVMIEGELQLAWACESKLNRARRWLKYTAAEEWNRNERFLRRFPKSPLQLSQDKKSGLLDIASIHLTSSARRAWREGRPLPSKAFKVFKDDWRGKRLSDIQSDLNRTPLRFDPVYAETSALVHWSPTKTDMELTIEDGRFYFSGYSEIFKLRAYQGAILSLIPTVRIANDYMELGFENELADLWRKYGEIFPLMGDSAERGGGEY